MWYFEKRDLKGVFNAPKHDEHFAHVRGVVTSLVRETIQNSGDAGNPATGKPVRMRFRFGKIEMPRFKSYIDGIDRHLAAPKFANLAELLKSGKPVPYLVIEDFETHGLRGSWDPSSGASESSYIAFWHRYGESGKSEQFGGRHGLGKSTIATASRLRLFFGATVSSESKEPRQIFLQGQICLLPHAIKDRSGKTIFYDAYGLWYDEKNNDTIPFIGKETAAFTHDFKLDRGRFPGLSLVIPFPHEDLTPDAIIRATIENCFHQILNKHLIVEIGDVVIDATSIKELASKHGLTLLAAALILSEQVFKGKIPLVTPRADTIRLRLNSEHFDTETLAHIRKRWADGRTVGVSLPVSVHARGKAAAIGEVQLYVQREQNEQLARETYVRGRVTVPIKAQAARSNCVGLLVADVGVASAFLGDSEPPAHDRWNIGRLREGYTKPEEALNRIKHALSDLLTILDAGEDQRAIKDAFAEYLWAPKIDDIDDDDRPKPKKPAKSSVEKEIPPPRPKPHLLQKVDGGFSYSYRPAEPDAEVASARILVSYRRRATPKKSLKKAKFADFDGDMVIDEVNGNAAEQVVEPRRVIFTVSDVAPGYEMRVTGFDSNRDLELQLETVSP